MTKVVRQVVSLLRVNGELHRKGDVYSLSDEQYEDLRNHVKLIETVEPEPELKPEPAKEPKKRGPKAKPEPESEPESEPDQTQE